MSKLVGVLNTSHVWIHRPIAEWDAVRASRQLRGDVPEEDDQDKQKKFDRVSSAIATLKATLSELRPDALIVIGDDQSENFSNSFVNIPKIAIYVGEEFAGHRYDLDQDSEHQRVPGHPNIAKALLVGLNERQFDPAFCMNLPNPARGIGHAIINPVSYFTNYSVPTVPVIINALFAPQITARRGYELGCALREIIDSYPEDLRIAVIGSGGLWHTTGHGYNTYLNEEFDQAGLEYLRQGDIRSWADHFDSYEVASDDMSQYVGELRRDMTGMPTPGGPQFGTRETINWITASATAEGSAFTIVDYVPIYSSPIGTAFAYCDNVL